MEREDTVIELGAASVETQGGGPLIGDEALGLVPFGLTDD
ncbi:benenodin family lasso peptide [Sphingosinithalassobacter sp. CS137]|nr:benenodin family lasso peptide [Sphingosinithalassobacter sp. CS137]